MDIAGQSKSFARGLETGLVQEPLDAVRQIAYHAGLSREKVDDHPRASTDTEQQTGLAFQAGKTVGKIAEFWLINRAVGAVSGIGNINALSTSGSEAIKMGMSGVVSGVLTPVSDQNFSSEKLSGIVSEGASFGTFGAVNGRFAELGILGRPGFRKFWQDATVNATAGALSGFVGADVHSLLSTGSVAPLDTIGKTMMQNAIMGIGFSALDHSLPRAAVKFRPDSSGIKGSAHSSEDWSVNVYESSQGELRSPILTWLADKNLVPKPPQYSQLRKAAWADRGAVDLSLADWSPQQRPAVIQALRRIGHPDLGKDANIDAFLSRLTSVDATAKFDAYREFQQPMVDAKNELEKLLAASPAFKNISPQRVQYDPGLKSLLDQPENASIKDAIDRINILNAKSFGSKESAELDKDMLGRLNGIADEIGIPTLKSVNVSPVNSSSRIADTLYLGVGKSPELNAMSADNIYHEFTHHTQGQFYDRGSLLYLAKYPYYYAAKRLGFMDEIPIMQSPRNRQEYINNYIGSDQENQAWATGLLVRIRAVAAGMKNFQD